MTTTTQIPLDLKSVSARSLLTKRPCIGEEDKYQNRPNAVPVPIPGNIKLRTTGLSKLASHLSSIEQETSPKSGPILVCDMRQSFPKTINQGKVEPYCISEQIKHFAQSQVQISLKKNNIVEDILKDNSQNQENFEANPIISNALLPALPGHQYTSAIVRPSPDGITVARRHYMPSSPPPPKPSNRPDAIPPPSYIPLPPQLS